MKPAYTPPIFLLILLIGFPQISETIYTPSLPDIARAFAVDNALVNLTLSIYFVGFALGVLAWGRLSDRMGRRPAMLWGIFIYIVGCVACYASSSIASLVLFRFVQAFGASAGSVVTQTMMRDVFSGKRRSQIFSIVGGAIALTPAIGPFIGGFVDEWFGFHANFIVLLLMGIILYLYSFFSLPETRPQLIGQSTNLFHLAKRMIQDRVVLSFAFLIAACNGILFSYYGEAPFIFVELLHFTPSQYGMFGLAVAAPILVASFLSHRLNAKMSSESIIGLGVTTMLMGSLILLLTASMGLIVHRDSGLGLVALMGPMMIVFIGMGLVIPNSISLALQSYQDVAGSAGAIFGLIYYVLIGAMTELMGIFHDGSALPMPLYFVVLSTLTCAVFFRTETKLAKLAF